MICNIGRHSIYLATYGYNTVGYDHSAPFLRRARQLAERMRLWRRRVRFYCGKPTDMVGVLQSTGEGGFDAIISMVYSFGYSGRQADVRLFNDLHKLSNSRCVLVIETGNREFWRKHFQRYLRESFPRRLERFITFSFDGRKSILRSDWEFHRKLDDKSLRHLLSVQASAMIYSRASLSQLLRTTGWRPVRAFENIQHPRRVSDLVPHFYLVALRR